MPFHNHAGKLRFPVGARARCAVQTCFKSTPEGSRVEACFVKKDLCLNNRTHYPNATWQTPYSYFVAGTQLNKLVSRLNNWE